MTTGFELVHKVCHPLPTLGCIECSESVGQRDTLVEQFETLDESLSIIEYLITKHLSYIHQSLDIGGDGITLSGHVWIILTRPKDGSGSGASFTAPLATGL